MTRNIKCNCEWVCKCHKPKKRVAKTITRVANKMDNSEIRNIIYMIIIAIFIWLLICGDIEDTKPTNNTNSYNTNSYNTYQPDSLTIPTTGI